MFADLHLHSQFSDGTFTPEEMVARARRSGPKPFAPTVLTSMRAFTPNTKSRCASISLQQMSTSQ
jgi:histidinol phosphatase-like PHP family hydrolase